MTPRGLSCFLYVPVCTPLQTVFFLGLSCSALHFTVPDVIAGKLTQIENSSPQATCMCILSKSEIKLSVSNATLDGTTWLGFMKPKSQRAQIRMHGFDKKKDYGLEL